MKERKYKPIMLEEDEIIEITWTIYDDKITRKTKRRKIKK